MSDLSNLPTRASDMFCYAVYAASHSINRAYAPLLKDLGLTYPQYITLTLLWEEDGLSIGALASRLQMETSTVTPLVKRLEKLGHVKRQRGTQDERQVFVHLTDTGTQLRTKAPQITACMIEATGLDKAELDRLVSTLCRLTKNLKKDRGNSHS